MNIQLDLVTESELNAAANQLPAEFAVELQAIWYNWMESVNALFTKAANRAEGRAAYVVAKDVAPRPVSVPFERIGEDYKPTKGQFTAYQGAFDWFNRELFNGELPQCLLNFSRKAGAGGFFARNQWGKRLEVSERGAAAAQLHEITLNPDLLHKGPEWVFSVLVHEMAHLQRFITGKPSRPGYHDAQWADMMLAVGLHPVSYDNPGRMTGQKVSHEIVAGGFYQAAFKAMPSEYLLPLSALGFGGGKAAKPKRESQQKVKYTCPGCEANIWGKGGLNVTCTDCQRPFEAQ